MSAALQPLHLITSDKLALLDAVVEAGGELPPDVDAQLALIEEAFDKKLGACALWVKNLIAEADKHDGEAQRQASRAAVLRRSAESFKGYIKTCMIAADCQKVDGVARLQKAPASVIVECDPASLPDEFKRISIEPRKIELREAWKAGKALPAGVRVDENGVSLRLL